MERKELLKEYKVGIYVYLCVSLAFVGLLVATYVNMFSDVLWLLYSIGLIVMMYFLILDMAGLAYMLGRMERAKERYTDSIYLSKKKYAEDVKYGSNPRRHNRTRS